MKGQWVSKIIGNHSLGDHRYRMYFVVIFWLWNKVLGRWKDGQMDQTIDTENQARCSQSYRSILKFWGEPWTCLREKKNGWQVTFKLFLNRIKYISSLAKYEQIICLHTVSEYSNILNSMWLITQLNRCSIVSIHTIYRDASKATVATSWTKIYLLCPVFCLFPGTSHFCGWNLQARGGTGHHGNDGTTCSSSFPGQPVP